MFIFSLTCVCLWGAYLAKGDLREMYGSAFVLAVLISFVFYGCLEHLFRTFTGGIISALVSVFPSVVLFFLVKDIENFPYLQTAVMVAALLRLFTDFVPFREKVVLFGSFILLAVAVSLRLSNGAFWPEDKAETAAFACLAMLVMSGLQYLILEKGKEPFPYAFFVVMAVAVVLLPAREEPINWNPVIDAGKRFVQRAEDAYSDAFYFASGLFKSDDFATGYSNLGLTGASTSENNNTELFLRTKSQTYVLFKDKENGKLMKRRRSVYLVGGRGVDKERIVDLLTLLYRAGATKELTDAFSQKTTLELEYGYLRTGDEIAPMGCVELTSSGKPVLQGSSDSPHKKGYTLDATYIDIDYGSPYFVDVVRNADSYPVEEISYKELCDYGKKIYTINLDYIITEEEYAAMTGTAGNDAETMALYIDTTGCSPQLSDLAHKLTDDLDNEYDKCRIIEEYLRQFPYNLNMGDAGVSDMSKTEGMSELAEVLLFQKGEGYCVHYASAMTMLLRLSGIPARCDAGYSYLYPFEEQEEYRVEASRAHTWPEAYIEGAGWIPFEPTGAYLSAADRTWNREPKQAQSVEDVGLAEGYLEGLMQNMPEIQTEGVGEVTVEPVEKGIFRLITIVVAVILSVLFLFLVLLIGTMLVREALYKRATFEEKLRTDVELIKKDIRKHSDSFFDRGLLSDYEKRAPEVLRQQIGEIFGLYYRAEYAGPGSNAISEVDSRKALEIRKKLHESYKKDTNKKRRGS